MQSALTSRQKAVVNTQHLRCCDRAAGLLTVLLEPLNGTFWVGCIYGRNDDASRFGYFCGAAAEYLRVANIQCARLPCLLSSALHVGRLGRGAAAWTAC